MSVFILAWLQEYTCEHSTHICLSAYVSACAFSLCLFVSLLERNRTRPGTTSRDKSLPGNPLAYVWHKHLTAQCTSLYFTTSSIDSHLNPKTPINLTT